MKADDRFGSRFLQIFIYSGEMAGYTNPLCPGCGIQDIVSNDLSLDVKCMEKDELLSKFEDGIYHVTDIGQELADIAMEEEKRILKKDDFKNLSKKFRGLSSISGDLMYGLSLREQILPIIFKYGTLHVDKTDCLLRYQLTEVAIAESAEDRDMLDLFSGVCKHMDLEYLYAYIEQDEHGRLKDRYALKLSPKSLKLSPKYSKIREAESLALNEIRVVSQISDRAGDEQNADNVPKKEAGNVKKDGSTQIPRNWDDENNALGNRQAKEHKNKNFSSAALSGNRGYNPSDSLITQLYAMKSKWTLDQSRSVSRTSSNHTAGFSLDDISSNEIVHDDKFIVTTQTKNTGAMTVIGHKEDDYSLATKPIFGDIDEIVSRPEEGAEEIRDFIETKKHVPTPVPAEDSFESTSEEAATQQHSVGDCLKIQFHDFETTQTHTRDVSSVQERLRDDCGTCHILCKDAGRSEPLPESSSPDAPSSNALRLRLPAKLEEASSIETEQHSSLPLNVAALRLPAKLEEASSIETEQHSSLPLNVAALRLLAKLEEASSIETEQHSSLPLNVPAAETGNEPGMSHETLLARMENQNITFLPACTNLGQPSLNGGTATTSSQPKPAERRETLPVQVTTAHASGEVRFFNQHPRSAHPLAMNRACHPQEETGSEQCSTQHSDAASQASCSFAGTLGSRNGSYQPLPQTFELNLTQSPVSRFLSERERGQQVVVHAAGSLPSWATRTPQIDLSRVASPSHIPLRSRRATYIHWPREVTGQQPANMALAGYFYTGEGNTVRCFYCGVQISSWRPGMDPWDEHIRGQPTCQYLVKMKGEDFVRAIQKEQKSEK